MRSNTLRAITAAGFCIVQIVQGFSVGLSRRKLLAAATTTATTSVIAVLPARADTAILKPEDVARIQKGYNQIEYLLANFDKETTICRENGGECKRDADAIRRALGLRSTTDPLFQIEKVFGKIKSLDDFDKLDAFFNATEDWNSATSMSNSMAFISQFGEYNPGGGQDEVLKYLLESKKQVVLARDALRIIMNSLDIPITT